MHVRLSLVILLLALPRAARADRVKVAVVPSISVNLDAARVDVLSQDLAEALRTELEVDAIGGLEVRRLLPPQGLPADCVANQACIADTARRLGARQLLFVVMIDTGTGGAIQVDSTWVDAGTKKSVSRPAIDIASVSGAKAQFAAAASQLFPDAPIKPKPKASLGQMSPEVSRHLAVPSYLTAAATAIGVGVGVGVGISVRNKYQACEDQATHGAACTSSRKDSIRKTALIADAGWAVAIGGMVATAVLYATSGEKSHLVVEPTPGGLALSAVGRF
jgi:hypothetical protein